MTRLYFELPSICPSCGFSLRDYGSFLFCDNNSCLARISGAIRHWVSHLGILNWGDVLIDSLSSSDSISITRVADIYDLSVDQIALHCSGIKFATKCHDSLHSAKTMTLVKFLSGLNIPNLGTATATDIVSSGSKNLDQVLTMSVDSLCQIPNVGLKTATTIYDHLEQHAAAILALSKRLDILDVVHGPLSGKSFCITGSTVNPRKFLHTSIMNNGGIVKESVASGLSYLISNENSNSSKFTKARKFAIPVITEADFLKMIEVLYGVG